MEHVKAIQTAVAELIELVRVNAEDDPTVPVPQISEIRITRSSNPRGIGTDVYVHAILEGNLAFPYAIYIDSQGNAITDGF